MTPTEQLLALSERYCALRGISERTASGRIFKDSRTILRVKDGGSLTLKNFEKAVLWFSENWPDSSEWPSFIERSRAQAMHGVAGKGIAA